MIGKYKDFYRFVQCNNASICDLWEKYMTYPNPTKGDKYILYYTIPSELMKYNGHTIIFDKVDFDSNYKNGTAFWYIFHEESTNEEIKIYSINDIKDYKEMTFDDKLHAFAFWKYCAPVSK
jgi:hypothetical protein